MNAIVLDQSINHQHRHLMIPKLSDDVIVEILARLPVRSLLKFRCVCKSWLSLISSPHFVKTHLTNSKTDADCTLHGFMLNFLGDFKKCCVPSLLNEPVTEVLDVGYSARLSRFPDPFVGCCDGLICLAIDREHLILWNPSTRVVKKLPRCTVTSSIIAYYACGFGYDKSSDDYKVFTYVGGARCPEGVVVEVYSLKSDKWKRITSFTKYWLMGNATFVNGKLHWVAYPESKCGLSIVFLDLQTEEYGIGDMPDWLKGDFSTSLGESGGRLVVFCNHLSSGDLWIVDDDGAGCMTFTKVVTIPYNDFPKYKCINSVYLLKNGRVVLHCGSKFVVFDTKDCNFRYPVVMDQSQFLGAVAYFESLVSLVGG